MELPLFPLHLVLFPGRQLPLHLFELRYRRMLADCMQGGRCFGVVAIRAGREAGHVPEVHGVGTIAAIERVEELSDGRFDIVTRGTRRFRLLELLEPAPYLRAEVEVLQDGPAGPEEGAQAQRLRELLVPYLAALGAPEELLERVPVEPNELAYLAASAVQVELQQQQRLLELDTTGHRLDATLRMLRREAGIMRHFGSVGSLRPPGPGGADLN